MMKNKRSFIFNALVAMIVFSCGTDTRELAADLKKKDAPATATPDTALQFFQVLDKVPELRSGFNTSDFNPTGTYTLVDTVFVRQYSIVPTDYVFEIAESWQIVGKMYLPGHILVIVHYARDKASNLDLFVYDPHAVFLCSMTLAINMPPEGIEVPAEATINPQGLVSVVFKEGTSTVKKDFQLHDHELKLVKAVQLP